MLGLAAPSLALMIGVLVVGAAAAGAVWGRWSRGRGFGRSLAALDEAARRIERGEPAQLAEPPLPEIAGLARSFNAMAVAIDERERVSAQLAMSDPETGLANRRALEAALGALAGAGAGVAVAAVAIDRFDALQGAIGHDEAANLISDIGQRLAERAPDAAVGRVSEDVLGMVFGAGGAEAARATAAALAAELEGPVRVGEATADISLSVGVAPAGGPAAGERSPLVRAAIAAEQARAAGRKATLFDAKAYGDPTANLALISEIGRAIETGQIEVHLQPKYDIRHGRTVGVEALARWAHPRRGLLSPGVFVRLAETTGHIRALTDHVLERAIADQAALRRAGHALDVSVNITGRLLSDAGFAEHVLKLSDAGQGRLWLEVTAAAFADDPDGAMAHVERFAEADVGVAIDDFGAGPLSLARLRQIRAEEVKIDPALILDMADEARNTRLVRAAVELAHGLGMKVTAKGVETNEAYALLAGMGCDFAQGFLIERPMPLNDLLAFLAEDRAGVRFG